MVHDIPELMTVQEYAKQTGSNENAIRYQCVNGILPAQKVGKKWFIARDLVFKKLIELERKELCRN